ncbi:hypothetical protein DRN86_00215 [Candidatus Geothermarchaeota archaeon]|nr:MAG: hypothetical protein DRN86_00215 [Candidatus Geothermarchaeota archaeon]
MTRKGASSVISSVILVFVTLIIGLFCWYYALSMSQMASSRVLSETRRDVEKFCEWFIIEHAWVESDRIYLYVTNFGKMSTKLIRIYVNSQLPAGGVIDAELDPGESCLFSVTKPLDDGPYIVKVMSERGNFDVASV